MRVKRIRDALLLAALLLANACGGDKPVTRDCDEHTQYREAREHRRVEPPEGMTPLDPSQEMPVPEPSPQAERPPDAPCLDLPPTILSGESAEEE